MNNRVYTNCGNIDNVWPWAIEYTLTVVMSVCVSRPYMTIIGILVVHDAYTSMQLRPVTYLYSHRVWVFDRGCLHKICIKLCGYYVLLALQSTAVFINMNTVQWSLINETTLTYYNWLFGTEIGGLNTKLISFIIEWS